jgi:hypothetical protein
MRSPVPLLLAAAVTSALLTVTPSVASTTGGPSAPCGERLQPAPLRAQRVQENGPRTFAAAAEVNETSVARLAELAEDETLWLDGCGMAFYREPAVELAADGTAAYARQAAAPPPGTDVLALESEPGARRTILLDVDGGTVTDTEWNKTAGTTIKVEPYSLDTTATTAYSAAERTAIYDAWSVVAEDFAPFSVNVTTRDPGFDAIHRSDKSDAVYGSRVYLTQRNAVQKSCKGCSGVAYLKVFGAIGSEHSQYQPAWVFTDGLPAGYGDLIGDIASHEVGHNFGLEHDGNQESVYHGGNTLWSPVMGGSTAKRLNQWSRGEYPGATNKQDDLAVIARNAPRHDDPHGDTPAVAAPLGDSAGGLVGWPTDVDAFTFTASGTTTLRVRPTSDHPNLDVVLTVLDSTGATVAVVDPPTTKLSATGGSGLDATWRATLPATAARYTALVDGTGYRTPATGGYTDYGSLGRYEVTLDTVPGEVPPGGPDPDDPPGAAPLTFVTGSALRDGRLRRAYSERVKVTGGEGAVNWRRTGTLPRGVQARVSATGKAMVLSGRPKRTGRFEVRLVVTDGGDQRVAKTFSLRVRRR